MRNETMAAVKEHLENLSDVFGVRQPTPGALKVWMSALTGVDEKFVLQAFTLWPDHNRKMPAPVDIRQEAFKLQSEWIEEEQRIAKADFARSPSAPKEGTASQATIRAFKRHQAIIALSVKNTPDDQWQWNLLDKFVNNKPNSDGTRLFACQLDTIKQLFGNPVSQQALADLPRHLRRNVEIPPFSQILAEEREKLGVNTKTIEQQKHFDDIEEIF